MREYDIGFIVPLHEEFRVFRVLFPVTDSEVHDAIYYHALKLPHDKCRAVAVVLGGMGKNLASQVTEKVLNHVRLKAIVLLGIAGALDRDLKLGDVVVADEISEFLAASKALERDGSSIFQYSGKHWNTSHVLKQCAGHLEFSNEALYDAWQAQARDFRNSLMLTPEQMPLTGDFPQVVIGPIASGDTVGASEEYAAQLRGINRKFCALEMEAAGVAQAAHGRKEQIPIMVVRGISDFADDRKKVLDEVGNGAWRKYAMYSASAFVLHLLGAEDFQQAVTFPPVLSGLQSMVSEQMRLAHLDALARRTQYIRWADRPVVREATQDHYIPTESKILPMYASPYDDDTGQQREELLQTIRNCDRLLVLGEPGVGKTSALERMMWETAAARASVVPVYVPLSFYDGDLMTEVGEALGETGVLRFDSHKDIDVFLRKNPCQILFDGLNEVRGNQHAQVVKDIENFVRAYRHHRYVITSRSQDTLWRTLRDRKAIPSAVVIQSITDDQVREYFSAHLGPQKGRETYDSLNERLQEIVRTPLFLWMLKGLRQTGSEVPGNRGELFDQFIDRGVFTRDEEKLRDVALPRSVKKKALADLAFALQREHRRTCLLEEAIAIVAKTVSEHDPRAIIREAQDHGLLKLKRQQLIEFMHHAVQEYFVALKLKDMVANEAQSPAWQQFGKRMLRLNPVVWAREEWWAESFVQLAGLTEHSCWLVQEVAKVNPWLAFWCMIEGREVDDQTESAVKADTVDLLHSDDIRKRQRVVRELGRLKNPRTTEYLIQALDDETEEVVNMAVQGLGRLGEPAVRHLSDHLQSKDIGVRQAATRALGLIWQLPSVIDLGSAETSLRLAALDDLGWRDDKRPVETVSAVALYDTDHTVRQRAVEVLVQLADARYAVGPLLTLLTDHEPSVRASAAKALGQIKDEQAKDERVIESLLQALQDKEPSVRRCAIVALGQTWKWPLLERLGYDNPPVRQRAALELGQQGDARAVQPLIVTLLDKDEAVCASTATALGQLKSGQAVDPLISVLLTRPQEPVARMSAAAALGELGDRRAISPLLVALKDPDSQVRWGAAKSLGQLRAEQAIGPLLALCAERGLQECAVNALVQIGPPAVPSLIAALSRGDRELGIGAAIALGRIGGSQALRALIFALERHANQAVRVNVAWALGRIGGEQAIEALVSTLGKTGHSGVRCRAALSLGQLGGPKAIETLAAALKDQQEIVRRAAICALGYAQKIERLRHLGDKDPNIRQGAAIALGQQREKEAIEPLKATLKDSDEAVRCSATHALGLIWRLPELVRLSDQEPPTRQQAAAALGDQDEARAVEPLIAALRDSHAGVRWSAARALGQLRDETAVQPLIEALDDGDRKVQRGAAEALQSLASVAIPCLVAALRDSNYWFRRRRAAETLAEIGDPRSLIEALKHRDKHVRRSAAESLAKQDNIEAVEPLIAAVSDPDDFVRRHAVEALGRIGDSRAAQPIAKILQQDEDWRVRQGAAEALGRLGHGDKDIVESLVSALEDEEWPVRWMAAKALGELGDPRAVMPLIQAMGGDWPALWTVAEALGQLERSQERPIAIGSLVTALQDREGDKYVKDAAVEALGQIGEPIQQPLIDTVLRKGDQESRRRAIEALGQMGNARNLQPLIEALQDTKSYEVHQGALEALVQLGDAAVESLKVIFQNPDPLIKRRGVLTLKQIGNARAVQLLGHILDIEETPLIKSEIEAALKSIDTPEAQAILKRHTTQSAGSPLSE